TAGLYAESHERTWTEVVERVHQEGGRVAALLGHAGARGSTRPRREGVDRPLRERAWPLVAASPIPYTRRGHRPGELDREGVDQITAAFADAARRAANAAFDALMIDMARGRLLAGFLSPLTNRRTDEYGGDLEARARFPLEVFE